MNTQNLLKDPNTNWKYIFIVALLAFLIGGGILGYQYLWLPKQELEMPEIEIPEKPVEDETADWKTYRNEEYGFEMKYPKEWYTLEYPFAKEKGLFFVGFSTDGTKTNMEAGKMKEEWAMVEITRMNWKPNRKIRDFFKEAPPEDQPAYYEIVMIRGIESLKALQLRDASVCYFIPKGDYLYQIKLLTSPPKINEYKAIFDHMLSTFRFLE